MVWWNKLTKLKQLHYETQMFGYGEMWEDNTLNENDIIKIYLTYGI